MMIRAVIVLAMLGGVAAADDAGVDASVATCGDGVRTSPEWCDTAIPSGSPGACYTNAQCYAAPPGTFGGGCAYILQGTGCDAHCVAGAGDCEHVGSGSNIDPPPDDDGSCNAGGAPGLVIGLCMLLALRSRRR